MPHRGCAYGCARVGRNGKPFEAITVTHVDTSTAVLADLKAMCDVVKAVSPDTLVIVDAVCSAAGEELRMDEWGVDFVLTGSQKAFGVPPGLSIMCASQKAMSRLLPKDKIKNYFCNMQLWLPIMEAYEARKPSYFVTPACNLIGALRVGLEQMQDHPNGMDDYFRLHRENKTKLHKIIQGEMGLELLTESSEISSNLLTCMKYPAGKGPEILPIMKKKGWILAAGLHPILGGVKGEHEQLVVRHLEASDVEREAIVPPGVVAQQPAVEPHGGLPVNRPKVEQHPPLLCAAGVEAQPVPHARHVRRARVGRLPREAGFHRERHENRLIQAAPKRWRSAAPVGARLKLPQAVEREPARGRTVALASAADHLRPRVLKESLDVGWRDGPTPRADDVDFVRGVHRRRRATVRATPDARVTSRVVQLQRPAAAITSTIDVPGRRRTDQASDDGGEQRR